ncbi:MAG: AMP-binding protein, partial [bacterium]|nr:AMP-binding protein [bacterium]
ATENQEKIEINEIREKLTRKLPVYMIPTYMVQVENIPLTESGKVDRNALPAPQTGAAERPFTKPGTALEKTFAEIWAGVLHKEKDEIGIDDSFFTIGGHSLNAVTMISKIHKETDVRIPLPEVFKNDTIRALNRYVKKSSEEKYETIGPAEKREYYQLSSAQKRLYILQQMEQESIAYNITEPIHLAETPEREKLERTIWKLIERHESLRTSFHMVKDTPVQEIHHTGEIKFSIEEYDLTTGKHPKDEPAIIRPFDLTQPPLLRVGLIKTGPPEPGNGAVETNLKASFILQVDMHHIISDGVSHEILEREFIAIYEEKELAPVRIYYKDFAQWQNSEKVQNEIKQQEAYWLKQFDMEIPQLEIPADYSRPAIQSFEGNYYRFSINAKNIEKIREKTEEKNVTTYVLMLTLFSILLSKLSASEEIIIGTPVAGRRHADLEQVIGMFVNTLVLRNEPTAEKTVSTYLKEVKDRTLEAFENQDYPFEQLVEKIEINRDAGRNPLFDVMFAQQDNRPNQKQKTQPAQKSFIREGGRELENENAISKFDLTMGATETADKLNVTLEYSTKLFKKETIKRYAGYFEGIVEKISQNPHQPIGSIELISQEEKKQQLIEFNRTGMEYPKEKTIHRIFEEQVEKTPGNVAVFCSNEKKGPTLTYEELNEKARRYSRILRQKGLAPGNIVAFLTQQTPQMIIAILATWKTGGTYLPLGIDYPAERIAFILKDSNARLLLTAKNDIPGHLPGIETLDLEKTDEISNQIGEINEPEKEGINREINEKSGPAAGNAYVIYTSGTTGKPKGVMIRHYSYVNRLHWMQEKFRFNPDDVILQKTVATFDVSVCEMFRWIKSGGRLCLLEPGGEKDPAIIIKAIETHRVTTSDFVPMTLEVFLDEIRNRSTKPDLSTLKWVFVGADTV